MIISTKLIQPKVNKRFHHFNLTCFIKYIICLEVAAHVSRLLHESSILLK